MQNPQFFRRSQVVWLYVLAHMNKRVEALCLSLILSARESMFRAKKRPTAERICGWQKKLPQMVGFMYEMLGFFGLEMPKEGLF